MINKFRHQNKKTTIYRLLVCSFTLVSVTDVMSIFRRQQRFFPCFADFDELSAEKFNGTRMLILDKQYEAAKSH